MSRKKKHPRKKPLSPEEKERRLRLRDERIKRKKRKNRLFYLELFFPLIVILILVAFGLFLGIRFGESIMIPYFSVCLIVIAVLTDRSGIRSTIFHHYPDSFFLSEKLKKDDEGRSFIMELARTGFYFSIAMYFLCPFLLKLWAFIVIISIIAGFYYIIIDTNDEYTFNKFSKYSDSTLFLHFSGLFGLSKISEVHSIEIVVTGTIIITGLYLLLEKNKKKGEMVFEMIVTAPMNIMTIMYMISVF